MSALKRSNGISIFYQLVLSTINFSSTKDHGRFVGDEAFNIKSKALCALLCDWFIH